MSPEEKQARREAYVNHLCVDCKTARHSAGRTRCDRCHQVYAVTGGIKEGE